MNIIIIILLSIAALASCATAYNTYKSKPHLRKPQSLIGILPMADMIVVLPEKDENEVFETMFKAVPLTGTVVATGPGKWNEPMRLRVGQKIHFHKHSHTSNIALVGKEDYLFMRQQDVLGID